MPHPDETKTQAELIEEVQALRQRLQQVERQAMQTDRMLDELTVLHAIATAIDRFDDEDELIAYTTNLVGRFCQADVFGIRLIDSHTGELLDHDSYQSEWAFLAKVNRTQPGMGITGQVAATGQAIRIGDVSQHPDYIGISGEISSELCVPIKVGEEILGVLNAESRLPNAYDETDEHLLTTVADQLARGIERLRLIAQTRVRALQQQVLATIARDILSTPKLESLWEAVWQAVHEALDGDGTAVYYYQDNTVSCPYAHNVSHAYIDELNRQFNQTLDQRLLRHRQAIVVDDILAEEKTKPLRATLAHEGFRAYAIFPFNAPNQTVAGLAIYRRDPQPFTIDDVATGEVLARIVGIALQNVQYFTEHTRALRREQQLNEMTRALNGSLDLPTVLSNVVRIATDLVQADAGALGLVVDNDKMFFYPYKMPPSTQLNHMPKGKGLGWEIVENGRSICLNEYASHEQAQPAWVEAGLHGFMGVPVVAGNERLGALGLFTFNSQSQFDPRDVAVVESVGRQAGVVIQNAYLYAESQRRNETLRQALAKQEELDELKSGFIRNVSHELRTPLGLIYGHASLLAGGMLGDLTEEQNHSMQIIARRATMLRQLVEDLTAMLAAQASELKQEIFAVTPFLNSIVEDFQLLAEEHQVHLESSIEGELGQMKGAPTHLRRVFDNLLANAFKFTPEDGRIWLDAWSEENQLIIEVGDNGIGIPTDQLHRVFERFYQVDRTTRRKFGGTGLGLAVVKEITEAHGGQVTITSAENEGTQFRLTFPLIKNE